MKTLKDYGGKVLIQYKRDSKRNLKGVVVSTASGAMGWSLCCWCDTFDKEKGLAIALARATKSEKLTDEQRDIYYATCPRSMRDIFLAVMLRSSLYFKHE